MLKKVLPYLVIPAFLMTTSCMGSKEGIKKIKKDDPKCVDQDAASCEVEEKSEEAEVTFLCASDQILDKSKNECVAKSSQNKNSPNKNDKKDDSAQSNDNEDPQTPDEPETPSVTEVFLSSALHGADKEIKINSYYCQKTTQQGSKEVCTNLKSFIDYCRDTSAPDDIQRTIDVLIREIGPSEDDLCQEAATSLNNRYNLNLSSGHGLTNVYPLAGLIKLERLNLNWNEVIDITPLNTLRNLIELRIENNKVKDVDTFGIMTQLYNGFYLYGNPVCESDDNAWIRGACK